jgi:hypothetical protein
LAPFPKSQNPNRAADRMLRAAWIVDVVLLQENHPQENARKKVTLWWATREKYTLLFWVCRIYQFLQED